MMASCKDCLHVEVCCEKNLHVVVGMNITPRFKYNRIEQECKHFKDRAKSIKPLNEDGKHPDCPLSEIPMHHGRLIDADATIARLKYLYCENCGNNCERCPWGAVIKYIDGRPTIIDAKGNDAQ